MHMVKHMKIMGILAMVHPFGDALPARMSAFSTGK